MFEGAPGAAEPPAPEAEGTLMPRQHFRCPDCQIVGLLEYAVADVEGPDWPPYCACGAPLQRAPQPGDFSFDLATDGAGGKSGQKFTIHRQVPTSSGLRQVEEVIDSAHARRRIERDAEQRYINGEGEPIRFRADHQSASNMDQNSFGTAGRIGSRTYDSGQQPAPRRAPEVRRHAKKPRVALGPGLVGRSPLKG